MKKIILTLAIFSLFGIASHSFAATCGDPSLNHAAYEVYPPSVVATTTIPAVENIICSNGDPKLVGQAWGLTGYQTPTIESGASMTDEFGVPDTCPKFYAGPCMDISRTDYYRNQMRSIARQLIANGFAPQFPMFAGWIASVR